MKSRKASGVVLSQMFCDFCLLSDASLHELVISFSQGLADSTVVAKVNDVLWDLDRPFEESSSLKLIKFDDPEG